MSYLGNRLPSHSFSIEQSICFTLTDKGQFLGCFLFLYRIWTFQSIKIWVLWSQLIQFWWVFRCSSISSFLYVYPSSHKRHTLALFISSRLTALKQVYNSDFLFLFSLVRVTGSLSLIVDLLTLLRDFVYFYYYLPRFSSST